MGRKSNCPRCGISRRLMIKAEVSKQTKEGFAGSIKFKKMCIPCLLKSIKVFDFDKLDIKTIYESVEE